MMSHVLSAGRRLFLPYSCGLLLLAPLARAADSIWTNYQASTLFLTNSGNWTDGVPGAGNVATFTNTGVFAGTMVVTNDAQVAMANVTVGLVGAGTLQYAGGNVWLVTNSFTISPFAASTSTVSHSSGTLVITNAEHTAQLLVGPVGKGGFNVVGGDLIVDRLVATNNSTTSYSLNPSYGSLTILAGSSIKRDSLTLGGVNNRTMSMSYLGGTNTIVVDGAGNNTIIGGNNSTRVGIMTVSGAGTLLSNSAALFAVGGFGPGTLVVSNGATVLNRNQAGALGGMMVGASGAGSSNSSVIITGKGSLLTNGYLTIGAIGQNDLFAVLDGGRAVVGNLTVGAVNTTNVVMLVSGAGSTLLINNAGNQSILGSGATADLILTNGGALQMMNSAAQELWLGSGANALGRVLISGSGSIMSYTNKVYVGSNNVANVKGRGMITVEDGGTLEIGTGGLVTGFAGTGIVSNRGGVYQFTHSAANITTNTPGTMVLENGTVSWLNVASVDINSAEAGKITRVGDNTFRLNTSTNAWLGAYTFQTNNGSNYAFLDVRDGGLFRATNLVIGVGGRVSGNGTVASMNATVQGTLAPGNSPGTMTFTSNLTLTASSLLSLEIAGTNSGAFDRLVVGGTLTKTGSVDVSLLNYNPSAGDSFDLLDWGAVLGSFASLNLPTLSGGLQWDSTQFESQGILLVVNPIPEPSVLALGALGAGLALALRRRQAS